MFLSKRVLSHSCAVCVCRFKQRNESYVLKVDQNSSSDYKGLTPRKVAEKLLPRAKGPQLLDEFDHYDQLWDILPDLSR